GTEAHGLCGNAAEGGRGVGRRHRYWITGNRQGAVVIAAVEEGALAVGIINRNGVIPRVVGGEGERGAGLAAADVPLGASHRLVAAVPDREGDYALADCGARVAAVHDGGTQIYRLGLGAEAGRGVGRRDRYGIKRGGRDLPHSTSVGAGRQDVEAGVVIQAEHLGVGQTGAETGPGVAVVGRNVHAVVSAHVQDVLGPVGLNAPGGKVGEVAGDVGPGLSVVGRLEDVSRPGGEPVDHGVGRGGAGRVGEHLAHVAASTWQVVL